MHGERGRQRVEQCLKRRLPVARTGQTIEKMEIAVRETQRVMGYADCSFMIGSPGGLVRFWRAQVRLWLSPEAPPVRHTPGPLGVI